MNRAAAITGALFAALGLSIFFWKTLVLHLPVFPSNVENLWSVELELDARGAGERGSVRVPLPSTGPGQVILDERESSDRLVYTIRTERDQRTAIWSGRFDGVHAFSVSFRAQLAESGVEIPTENLDAKPPKDVLDYLRSTARFPAMADDIRELLRNVAGADPSDKLGQIRGILGYVTDEIATVEIASDDALLTLAAGEGSPTGKVRLLVSLLRAAGFPARPATGLRLRVDREPQQTVWAELWIGGRWLSLSPVLGFFGARPQELLLMRAGGLSLVDETGPQAVNLRFRVQEEQLRPEEVAAFMVPTNRLLSAVSLYRLPIGLQESLRLLLLFPIGALVITCFRNLVGLRSFGTFMPLLISLALRELSLGVGLTLVASILAMGIVSRLLLDRLRLLLVPRLCVLLCIVVLTITAESLLGRSYQVKDLFTGLLFPVVILTMLIERFSITAAEEGPATAIRLLGSSTLIAICVYPVLRWRLLTHLMFGFPELVVTAMGVMIILGGYTGYRVLELWRFRALARPPGEFAP